MIYVTYDANGNLTGCYMQDLLPEHAQCSIEVPNEVRVNWCAYRANAARSAVELAPPAPPAPSPIPEEISPRQFRQALTKAGFRQQVESAINASTDQDLKDWYAYASAFQRHHPEVLAMAQQLGFTSAQLDQVWTNGATL